MAEKTHNDCSETLNAADHLVQELLAQGVPAYEISFAFTVVAMKLGLELGQGPAHATHVVTEAISRTCEIYVQATADDVELSDDRTEEFITENSSNETLH